MAKYTFQYVDHLKLKSRGFRDPLRQGFDGELVQNTCNWRLSGTKVASFLVACLYRIHSSVDEFSKSTSPGQPPTSATVSPTIFNHIPLWAIPVLLVVVTVTQGAVAALYLCFM